MPVIDRMADKGIMHKNKAARHKSRLNAQDRCCESTPTSMGSTWRTFSESWQVIKLGIIARLGGLRRDLETWENIWE